MNVYEQTEEYKKLKYQTYEGARNMGKTYASIGLIIVFIVFIILMYISFKMILNPHTKSIKGNVIKSMCSYQDSMNKSYICDIEIEYQVNDIKYVYKNSEYQSLKELKIGDIIVLHYDPSLPQKSTIFKPRTIFGYIIALIAVLMLILTLIFVCHIFTYDGLAYVSGISKVFLTH